MNGRRANWRFPLDLKLSYSVRGCPSVKGSGTTCDISSSGILFQADAGLEVRDEVELIIQWPVLLCETARLNLVLWGQIIRHDARGFAMIVVGSEFRTRGRYSSFSASAGHSSVPGVFAAHEKIPVQHETIRAPSSL